MDAAWPMQRPLRRCGRLSFLVARLYPALAFSHGCKPSNSSCIWRRVLAGSKTEEHDAPGRGRDRATHVHHPNDNFGHTSASQGLRKPNPQASPPLVWAIVFLSAFAGSAGQGSPPMPESQDEVARYVDSLMERTRRRLVQGGSRSDARPYARLVSCNPMTKTSNCVRLGCKKGSLDEARFFNGKLD
jgi:hypothetical protein